jgi:hypothetical protein
MAALIAATPLDKVVISSDCGVFLLPPPVEGLRELLLLLESCGVPSEDLRRIVGKNNSKLFRVGG